MTQFACDSNCQTWGRWPRLKRSSAISQQSAFCLNRAAAQNFSVSTAALSDFKPSEPQNYSCGGRGRWPREPCLATNPLQLMTQRNMHVWLSHRLLCHAENEACWRGWRRQEGRSWQALVVPHHRKSRQTIKDAFPVQEAAACSDQHS